MKIDHKMVILWTVSLILFTGVGVIALLVPDWLSGVRGLVIRFFLGYCSIIVVAQVYAFIEADRRLREDLSGKRRRYCKGVESV